MTSRRSFLRGLLALPAAGAIPAVAPDMPTHGGPIPGYGDGPIATAGTYGVVDSNIHMHADAIYVNGKELSQYVWDQWLAKQAKP